MGFHHFCGDRHDADGHDKEDYARPRIDERFFVEKLVFLVLDGVGCLGSDRQRIVFARWVVQVDA